MTNGGRILNVTGVGDDIAAARAAAYAAADLIGWQGVRRREDIALAASRAQDLGDRDRQETFLAGDRARADPASSLE